jgi:putative phosphoesterase
MNHKFLPPELPAERVIACFGLISDTHMPKRWLEIPAAVYDIFRGVDLVLHAGDVGELWVLDRLSEIAPVVAVHGNDETAEAQRELPYQQIVAVGGQRARQARDAGATIMVFGHLHIPFARRFEDVWLINPGAIASGSAFTRQTRQTVALLYWRDDGQPFVVHVDLAEPHHPYEPVSNWEAGFRAAANRYSESIITPRLLNLYPLSGGHDVDRSARRRRI